MADAVDRLKHALTLSSLDGTVRVRADDVITILQRAGAIPSPLTPADPGASHSDAEVWIPPDSDCMNHRHDPPCPHCGSTVFHVRTGRCGTCGCRPTTSSVTPEKGPTPS